MSRSPSSRASRTRRVTAISLTSLLAATAALTGLTGTASAAPTSAVAKAQKLALSGVISEINDWSCEPSEGQEPVVLIHGTFGFKKAAQARDRWSVMGRVLKDEGRCLYALEYGTNWLGTMGVKDIRDSAKQLATFVDGVKAATNASKVDLVGYSQGGLVARSYLKDRDGARSVDDLVTLGTPNRGTDTTSAWWGSWVYKAVDQMMPDSDFLKKLNKGGELMPGVSYTALATPEDGVVTPFTSAYLHGPTEQLTNATVPSIPGSDEEPHTEFCANPAAVQWVREALRSPGPANPYFKPVGTLA